LLPVAADVVTRLAGTPLLVMLDVDGTLAPIAARPEDAALPPATHRAVAALAVMPGVDVAFVSGRAAPDVARLTETPAAWIVGNHGYEIVRPDGATLDDLALGRERDAVAAATRALVAATSAMPGVIVEDKRWTTSVHFRLADPTTVPALRALVERVAAQHNVRVTEGKRVLEIRPHAGVHKGTAVRRLLREVLAEPHRSSALYVGDDTTDEDAFSALRSEMPDAVTVRVTYHEAAGTSAEFELRDPGEVLRFLEWLEQLRGELPGTR
jgi:trehalose 6-phosphate phosphatase